MMRRGTTRSKNKGAREAPRSRSVEGELLVRRGAMDAEEAGRIWSVDGCVPEDAAAIGRKAAKGRSMRKLSNKLIGAAGSSEGGKTAAVSAAKVAGGVAEESDVASQPAADEGTAVKERFKMSQEFIDWILSRKRRVLEQEDPDEYYNRMINDPDRPEVFTQQFLEEERHLMRNMATLSKRVGDRLEKFQQWVRDELKTKGCVEVDDDYFEQTINYRENYKKLHDAMMRVPGFIYKYNEEDAENQGGREVAVESN